MERRPPDLGELRAARPEAEAAIELFPVGDRAVAVDRDRFDVAKGMPSDLAPDLDGAAADAGEDEPNVLAKARDFQERVVDHLVGPFGCSLEIVLSPSVSVQRHHPSIPP